VAKRGAETLSQDEYAELRTLSEHIEELTARRTECLAELARKRGATLPELLKQLGIEPPAVI